LLGWADIPALHAVRIDAKRLRYTLESFREVLPPVAATLVERVTALQDHLGLLNDADIAARMTREHP
jgi:CHAD domain-containing protein